MLSLEELFCSVDDFCQRFEAQWERQLLGHGLQQRKRERSLHLSEIMTILTDGVTTELESRLNQCHSLHTSLEKWQLIAFNSH